MLKAIVVYLSTSGNTKAMADAIVEGARSRNIDAKAVNFHEAKIEECKRLGKDIANRLKKKHTRPVSDPKLKDAPVSVQEVRMGDGGH